MTKFNTNDRSASTDDAAGEANVSPMAPFRMALERIDKKLHDARRSYIQMYHKGTNRYEFDTEVRRLQEVELSRAVLLKAIKEATDHDKAGGRSSTPSG